jgi:transcriptional regulator of acetoin/glycerol metabolism
VRELENAIEHAFIMCHGQEIQIEHLPPQIVQESAGAGGISSNRQSEKEIIIEALRRHKGNRVRAAAELGVHRSTLWRKIRSYGIRV